jgi:hypothetical protein
MQLICPHCGKPVSAENINIQRMAAVCPACHTVFQFDPSESASKTKRRKIKQPPQITSYERDEQVTIAFRTNFRLDKNEAFLSSAGFSVLFTFITIMMMVTGKSDAALFSPIFGFFALFFYYVTALVAYNKTYIDISDDQITVTRKPLPNPLTQADTISLAGIESIGYEETAASKKEGYDTPRFNVWAEIVDGKRRLIVGDVVEDYAVFISQRLNELLDVDSELDVSRLSDDEWQAGDERTTDEHIRQSKSSLT